MESELKDGPEPQPAPSNDDDLVARLRRAESERDTLAAQLGAVRAAAEGRPGDALRNAFFAAASHELRTPLQSIALQLALLIRRVHDTADEVPREWLLDRLDRSQQTVKQMQRLIEGLLNLSELAEGRMALRRAEVDLGALAENVVRAAHEALAWAGCACDVVVEEQVSGTWDPLRLEIVLHNLLSNAMKYAPGCPIEVRVGMERRRAALSVADRGPGIPLEDQPRVFERFQRMAGPTGVSGFGLGLWIVRAIVQAHGGEVRLRSAPGNGSTFTVLLPTDAS